VRALILGGRGMLGRAVVAAARRRGNAALALSREQADVTDRERLLYWADAFRPDTVINCAAFTRVDDCESRPEHAFAVNGEGVANAVAAATRAGALLVQASTDYVFDGEADRPYREDDPTGPRSVYGESKLAGERHALAYERGLVVRTSWLFGPGGPNFVSTIVRMMEEGRRELSVVADQRGCPTYAPYLAGAILELARDGVGTPGIVHYRNREPVTWHDFAVEIVHLWDRGVEVRPATTAELARPARRPAYSVLDVERFESLTGRRVEPWGLGLVEYLAERRSRLH